MEEKPVNILLYSYSNDGLIIGLIPAPQEIWGLPIFLDNISHSFNLFKKYKIKKYLQSTYEIKVSIFLIKKFINEEASTSGNRSEFFYYVKVKNGKIVNGSEGKGGLKWFSPDSIKTSLKVKEGVIEDLQKFSSKIEVKQFSKRDIFILAVVMVLFGLITYSATTLLVVKNNVNKTAEEKILRYNAFFSGILKDDPTQLQANFIKDLKNGDNNKYTKSDAYFITHRFFDNGGNIYELYDYVNSHPELSFLKEAEKMYPNSFNRIKARQVTSTYTHTSYYAYLAYLEVLYNNGYTDIAAVSTLANQYAKLAYYNVAIAPELNPSEAKARTQYVKRDSLKAVNFLKASEKEIDKILKGEITSEDVVPQDILVGVNQYAAAHRYLKAIQEAPPLTPESSDISTEKAKNAFNFSMKYSRQVVPELELFTSLLNASTLAILASSTPDEIKVALYPILDFDPKRPTVQKKSIIYYILDSRLEKQPKNVGDTNMDIYGKRNIVHLSKIVPEFKKWLMNNGWVESDFKIN